MVPTANASHTDANRESRTASLDRAKKNTLNPTRMWTRLTKKKNSTKNFVVTAAHHSVGNSVLHLVPDVVLFLLTRIAFAAIITEWWYVARVSVWYTIHTDCRNCHIPIAPSPSSLTFLIGPPGCLSILSGQNQIVVCPSPPLCIHSHFQSHIAKKNVLNVGGFQFACAFLCCSSSSFLIPPPREITRSHKLMKRWVFPPFRNHHFISSRKSHCLSSRQAILRGSSAIPTMVPMAFVVSLPCVGPW